MFLSVITPFYNNFEMVKRCIRHLEKQTCKDFQLILINDASKNVEANEIKAFIQNSSLNCILICNDRNLGPGESRNRGIEAAEGRLITFLDSDDYLCETAIEKIYTLYLKYKFDCLIFDFFIKGKNCKLYNTVSGAKEGYLPLDMAVIATSGSTCCKVYQTNVIKKNNILFPNMYIKEDMPFTKLALYHSKAIFYYKYPLYYYLDIKTSLMHQAKTYDINNDVTSYEYLKKRMPDCHEILENLFVKELLYAGTLHLFLQKNRNDIKSYIKKWEMEYPNWFNNKYNRYLPIHIKVALCCIKLNFLQPFKIIAYIKRHFKF